MASQLPPLCPHFTSFARTLCILFCFVCLVRSWLKRLPPSPSCVTVRSTVLPIFSLKRSRPLLMLNPAMLKSHEVGTGFLERVRSSCLGAWVHCCFLWVVSLLQVNRLQKLELEASMGKGGREQVESSKVRERKSKRLRLAKIDQTLKETGRCRFLKDEVAEVAEVAQTLREMNVGIRRSDDTNDADVALTAPITSSDSSFEKHVQSKKRKKRGKTMMKTFFLTPGERAAVEFNELGQPIGSNSKRLSSYLGTLAREMVPVNISGWKKVEDRIKDDLWTCIQTRFIVDAQYKSLMIKKLGHRWKEAKSRLISAIKDASKSPDAANRLVMLKPDNIKTAQEWNAFIKEKLSKEFELKSKKYKEIRAKNNIPHTMSRKGYARLAEDLKKEHASDIDRDDLWCKGHTRKNGKPPNSVVAECITKIKERSSAQRSQGTFSLSEDGVAKTFGKERGGVIRGIGFGVTPSQFGVHMTNSKKVSTLENLVIGLQDRVQELTDMVMTSMTGRGNLVDDPLTPCANTAQSQSQHGGTSSTNSGMHTLQLPRKCKLLNWQKKVVAKGMIASTDPAALVHHVPLGVDTWKVWIDVPVEPQALLWRETLEARNIQQAVGTMIAWHKDFIAFD